MVWYWSAMYLMKEDASETCTVSGGVLDLFISISILLKKSFVRTHQQNNDPKNTSTMNLQFITAYMFVLSRGLAKLWLQ